MVRVAGSEDAGRSLKRLFLRTLFTLGAGFVVLFVLYRSFSARVRPDEFGVEQVRFGTSTGIRERAYGAGLYFVPPGTTMHTFPRGIHVLEASAEYEESRRKARTSDRAERVDSFFAERKRILGENSHRVIEALNIQTSDGYAVTADVTLLYSIEDPVAIAKSFGWGSLYVDSFATNTFRNGVLATLGKMNAESFYNEKIRIAAVHEAEEYLKARFKERGFRVDRLLLRNYDYADNYERSLHDKKVAVQLAEKNRKETAVNQERAKLQQIESKGNGVITIAESEVQAQMAKIRAEAELYSAQVRARADTEVNVAMAEAKRLKAEALQTSGGRYVVALETAKMFQNIEGAIMTPEQYISFIRNAWALIGVSAGSAGGAAAAPPAPANGAQR